jgi:nitroreductase
MSSIISVIHRRASVRTYNPAALSVEQKASIQNICEGNTVGPFGNKCRLELVDLSEAEKTELRGMGTYGFIRGTRLFIAGVITPAGNALLDFGYCFEKMVLELTDMGLGTCWMALTYNKAGFSKKIGVRENEALVIVSPVGVPSKRKSLMERFIKTTTRPRNKKPWQELFFEGKGTKPLTKEAAGEYAEPLECVRIAPSAVNYQPWRIMKASDANTFHFFMKQKGQKTRAELHAGIAMCHFGLAAQELGLKGTWKIVDTTQFPSADYFVSWLGI